MSPNRRPRKRKLSKQSKGNIGSNKRLKGRTLYSLYTTRLLTLTICIRNLLFLASTL